MSSAGVHRRTSVSSAVVRALGLSRSCEMPSCAAVMLCRSSSRVKSASKRLSVSMS